MKFQEIHMLHQLWTHTSSRRCWQRPFCITSSEILLTGTSMRVEQFVHSSRLLRLPPGEGHWLRASGTRLNEADQIISSPIRSSSPMHDIHIRLPTPERSKLIIFPQRMHSRIKSVMSVSAPRMYYQRSIDKPHIRPETIRLLDAYEKPPETCSYLRYFNTYGARAAQSPHEHQDPQPISFDYHLLINKILSSVISVINNLPLTIALHHCQDVQEPDSTSAKIRPS